VTDRKGGLQALQRCKPALSRVHTPGQRDARWTMLGLVTGSVVWVVLMVMLLSLGWHLGIALVFGLPALRQRYLRLERAINGVAGGALVLLGLQRVVGR
jgi:threonine/homoserine/homoserine lactone efflux protein